MAEPRHDVTRPMKREQCYLCLMTLVERPPAGAPLAAELRRPHKEWMADLERKGLLFGAGKLENPRFNEKSDFGYAMFILRAESREEAESIALEEPNTKAGYRTMQVIPWQRTEGDINISINFANGTVKIDRRSFLMENGSE